MGAQATYRQGPRRHGAQACGMRNARFNAAALARLAGVLLVIAAAIVVVLSLTVKATPPAPLTWSAVSVDHTGTLWEIAAEHPVEGLSTAETVDVIREENGLSSSTLHAGQTLVVPANAGSRLSVAQR